jgi:D-threonate/D-erythronate kinase
MTFSIPEFAIIADDLTGSLDTGLQFRKKGLTTVVPLSLTRPWPKAQALVLNTESRNISGERAYRKVYNACRSLKSNALYKKIDSTMRGNVGMEVSAILDAQKIPKALIVPAVPGQGRTVEKGILRVHGVPLLHTSYARDPFHPLQTSRIRDLLQKEIGQLVGRIALQEVRKDPADLAKRIERCPERLLVMDAVLQSDLRSIASAWKRLPGQALACGSVGLADELGFPPKAEKKRGHAFQGPLLIISASRNPQTAEQIEEVQRHLSLPMLEPSLHYLTNPQWVQRETVSVVSILRKSLSEGPGALLTTTFQEHFSGKERAIPAALGKVTARLLGKIRLGGLVLTGGDLAMGVCRQLAASALRVEEEVLPGIPCSTLIDGPFRGLRLVTKAGGFGEKDALWRIAQYLRGDHESHKT